jgi:hypothetical protein
MAKPSTPSRDREWDATPCKFSLHSVIQNITAIKPLLENIPGHELGRPNTKLRLKTGSSGIAGLPHYYVSMIIGWPRTAEPTPNFVIFLRKLTAGVYLDPCHVNILKHGTWGSAAKNAQICELFHEIVNFSISWVL